MWSVRRYNGVQIFVNLIIISIEELESPFQGSEGLGLIKYLVHRHFSQVS